MLRKCVGPELHTSIYPFILKGISLMGIDSGIALMQDRLRIWNKLATEWKPKVLQKLCREEPLDNLPKEIERIQKGEQVGKVLVNLQA